MQCTCEGAALLRLIGGKPFSIRAGRSGQCRYFGDGVIMIELSVAHLSMCLYVPAAPLLAEVKEGVIVA